MAKRSQVVEEVEKEEVDVSEETVETTPEVEEETAEVVAEETNKVSELSAYDKHGNLVRTFSREVHGEDFAEKAREFSKKGYTLK